MLISFYQRFISPLTHQLTKIFFSPISTCRFTPTCSQYTQAAIKKYGIIHGTWLGIKRIFRCHPASQGGHDPVP